jgi:hypothetical protein
MRCRQLKGAFMFARSVAAMHKRSSRTAAQFAPAPAPTRFVGNQAMLRRLAFRISVGDPSTTSSAGQATGSSADQAGAMPDQSTAPVQLQDAGAPAAPAQAPACGEKPKIKDTSPPPTTILGDNVIDFLNNVKNQVGDPYTSPFESHDLELDGKGVVTKVNMTLEISINRPRWGGGRTKNAKEKELILKAVELIKVHENRHRAIAEQMAAKAVCDALGKTGANAQAAITKVICVDMPKEQADYDMTNGQVVVVLDANGVPSDVKMEGVKKRPDYSCTK